MKRIILIYSLLLGLCFCSCESQLDNFPLDAVSPNTFFNTANELKLYTNSFYNMFPGDAVIYDEGADNIVKTTLTDEVKGTRIVPTTGGGWSWGDLRNINYFLEHSGKCQDKGAVAKYNGLARFFRAYFYFNMVKRFGDVPWYSKSIESEDVANLKKARDSRVLVMDSVMTDLDYAIDHLDQTKSVNEVTRWTALALKSRAGLYEGTWEKYHTEFNLPNANKFLDAAIAASEDLMQNSGYAIYQTTPQNAYRDLFAAHNAIGSEIILSRSYSADLQIYHNLNYYTLTSSYGRPGLEKRLVNSYLMKDGSRFTDQANYSVMQFKDESQNRDPRLSQTIRTPGYTRIGSTVTLAPNFGATVTGYQLIKFVTEPQYDFVTMDINDLPVFRYAEALLNFAEAKAERGTLTQADLDRSVKLIRDRVGMPNMNINAANANPDPYLSAQYTHVTGPNKGIILEIRRERRIELVMEGFRWDDLMRWKEGHLVAEQFKGMYFPGLGSYDLDGDGAPDAVIYTGTQPSGSGPVYLKLNSDVSLENGANGGNVIINGQISKVFDENKDYLYPIPIQERLLNPNLTQNPGWIDGVK